jgi:hypothetical protein
MLLILVDLNVCQLIHYIFARILMSMNSAN